MITIALVTPSLKAGGMEKVASQLANSLAIRNNLKVVLIVLSDVDKFYDLESGVIYHSCRYLKEDSTVRKAFRYVLELRRAFKKFQPSVVLSFGDRYNSFALLASIGFSHRRFISNRQNPYLSNGILIDFFNWATYRLADGIISQTEEARRIVKHKYSAKEVEVIPNPIESRQETLSPRENIILNVGRFGDAKNQFELVEIFKGISSEGKWKIHFYGDGPKLEYTKRLIELLDLNDFITIHPFIKQINREYHRSAIFAFVSRSEGFPNALAEAMAHGCACISYDCTAGPSDIIDDGINGFLIPVGDRKLYQEKLLLLMQDEELRIRFGRAAREKMKKFEAKKITQHFLDFMLKAISD